MKFLLTTYLTMSGCLLLGLSLQGQQLLANVESELSATETFNQKAAEISLEEALELTADHYKVFFSYYPNVIRPYSTTLPEVEVLTLEEALRRMLRNTKLSFQYTGERQLVIATKAAIRKLPAYVPANSESTHLTKTNISPPKQMAEARQAGTARLQPGSRMIALPVATVRGRVTDIDGLPMIGLSVQVKNDLGSGTVTDVNGNYSLSLPSLAASLIFSYTGYEAQTVNIGNREVVDVTMAPASELLEEVVVIGYGTRSARDLTGAVSAIDAKDIEKSPNISPEAAIQGAPTRCVHIYPRR